MKNNRKHTKSQRSNVFTILSPLADALMRACGKAATLGQKTGYKQGPDIVRLCADTLKEINAIVDKQENR